jgi:hypothetical protein
VEVVDPARQTAWVELSGPPSSREARTLGQVLDALTGGRWRETGKVLSLGELTTRLTGRLGESRVEDIGLEPGDPASLLLVRPQAEDAVDPDRLMLESIWVDGVEALP